MAGRLHADAEIFLRSAARLKGFVSAYARLGALDCYSPHRSWKGKVFKQPEARLGNPLQNDLQSHSAGKTFTPAGFWMTGYGGIMDIASHHAGLAAFLPFGLRMKTYIDARKTCKDWENVMTGVIGAG